eukprot:TRINITY_DN9223_c0_g1_i2.p1 TRINITY_DN9223_c0_g1~~TRINITY_DN9223_c0_g1_i2.p1  ORF type:complete len:272 (+),score=47.76 TRINITY_DN9223_c0_g1_i2:215-1030(+)
MVLSVVAMSTGGTWFSLLRENPPVLKACWRLTLTALMQIPGFAWEWYSHHKKDPALFKRWCWSIPRLILTGLFLGLHFAFWSWAVDNTSLTHSLLFINSGPIIIVVRCTLLYALSLLFYAKQRQKICGEPDTEIEMIDVDKKTNEETSQESEGEAESWKKLLTLQHWISPESYPPTLLEGVGTLLGFSGAALLVLKSSSEQQMETEIPVSVEGDFAAFLGALMFVLLLDSGSSLRQWMPLFIYTFPVTFVASVFLGVASLVMEGTTFFGIH